VENPTRRRLELSSLLWNAAVLVRHDAAAAAQDVVRGHLGG
jgi:hypothetical protein